MDLTTANVISRDRGSKTGTVFGTSYHIIGTICAIIRVNEIHEIALVKIFEYRMLFLSKGQIIPANMRDFKICRDHIRNRAGEM